MALTATATEQVRQDIIDQLDLQQARVFLSSFNRANLSYSVRPKDKSWGTLLSLLRQGRNQPAIIYCFSRRETESLADDLRAEGLSARAYHAGLDPAVRRRTQEDFVRDRLPIIVATIAFGMGIDKPGHSTGGPLTAYPSRWRATTRRRVGLAGTGCPANASSFFSLSDKMNQDYFINQIEDESEQETARDKLTKMVEFAQLPICRRRFILEYFGELWTEENCGGCDVCLQLVERFDATEITQKILSAVIRTGERFGANHVVQVLRGSRENRVLDLGHHRLSVYGIAKEFGRPQMREVMGQLQSLGLLALSTGAFPILTVSPEGREFLRNRGTLSLPRPAGMSEGRREGPKRGSYPAATLDYDEGLFEELRALRRRLANAQEVPAFVVFGDVSLRHMAATFPQSMAEFSRIPGVGDAKLKQYGPQFLKAIQNYAGANAPSI